MLKLLPFPERPIQSSIFVSTFSGVLLLLSYRLIPSSVFHDSQENQSPTLPPHNERVTTWKGCILEVRSHWHAVASLQPRLRRVLLLSACALCMIVEVFRLNLSNRQCFETRSTGLWVGWWSLYMLWEILKSVRGSCRSSCYLPGTLEDGEDSPWSAASLQHLPVWCKIKRECFQLSHVLALVFHVLYQDMQCLLRLQVIYALPLLICTLLLPVLNYWILCSYVAWYALWRMLFGVLVASRAFSEIAYSLTALDIYLLYVELPFLFNKETNLTWA